jgi:DNA-binding CsgD family transcriptional regulator
VKIADLLGLDPKTVRERLDRAGVTRRQPSQAVSAQVTESQERAILAGLADGATIFELARHHGLSSHTIQVIRNRHGLSGGRVMRRVRAALPDRDVALTRRRRQVVALVVGEPLSSTEAARRLGIARSTVDMHLSAVAARLASRADETNP